MSVNDIPSYKCFVKTDIPSVTNVSANSEINSKEICNNVRTRKELSLKEKLDILKMYDKLPRMSQRSAAIKLNISQPVLCKILKNRSFIENIMLTNKNSVRKRTRGGKEREIESALKLWYIEVQKKNIPINGQIIREKAKELAKQMGKEFAATDGWFTRWRKRENIVFHSLFRRKFKSVKDFDCFQNESKDLKTWLNTPNELNSNKFESSKNFIPNLDCQISGRISSEVPDVDEPKNWEKSFCEVFIKTEPVYEEEYQLQEKANIDPPTDDEMLEALRVLSAGVKHRTSELQLHYEYEHFIYQLLKRVV